MDRIRFVDHRGVRVLVLDFHGMRDPEETLREIARSRAFVATQPPASLRVMTVVRDARYNTAVLAALKDLAAANAPYVRASAVVGMSGLHRVAYSAVILFSKRNIQIFDTEAEALGWLAREP